MEIEIDLLRFEEISKRHDIKKPKWFALDNDIFSHPDFFKLTADEFKAWIWILCVASKVNKPKLRLDTEVFAHQCRCKENVFVSTLQKLEGKRLSVQIRTDPYGNVRDPYKSVPTLHNTTDTTDITNTTEQNSISTVAKKFAPVAAAKKLNEPISFVNEKALISSMPSETLDRWSALYPDSEFLKREAIKAFGYYENNPTKKPKTIRGWVRALSSWFERGWPKHAAMIKGAPERANLDDLWERGAK